MYFLNIYHSPPTPLPTHSPPTPSSNPHRDPSPAPPSLSHPQFPLSHSLSSNPPHIPSLPPSPLSVPPHPPPPSPVPPHPLHPTIASPYWTHTQTTSHPHFPPTSLLQPPYYFQFPPPPQTLSHPQFPPPLIPCPPPPPPTWNCFQHNNIIVEDMIDKENKNVINTNVLKLKGNPWNCIIENAWNCSSFQMSRYSKMVVVSWPMLGLNVWVFFSNCLLWFSCGGCW